MCLEVFVGFRKGFASEKSVVGGQRGRMCAFDDFMLVLIDERLFRTGVSAPEDKYDVLFLLGNQTDYAVGEPPPAAFGVRIGGVFSYGERGIQ